MNNMFISSAKKDEAVENFVKGKREELEKMIPDFVDDRKFTDIVLNFYERGVRDGAQMITERNVNKGNITMETNNKCKHLRTDDGCKWCDLGYMLQCDRCRERKGNEDE